MEAEIITIGDEILIGQIVDTNSAWLGQQLNLIGIKVKQINSVSDDPQHIVHALDEVKKRSSVIITTGGLGPTKDDLTKKTLKDYFGMDWRTDEDVLRDVEAIFAKFGREVTPVNKLQAQVPAGCITLRNRRGTAPGMWFEQDGKIFISLPGVPFEMKGLMKDEVLPRLKAKFKLPFIYHKTILTQGIGESMLADMITDWENSLAQLEIKLAYLPSPGLVRLRMTASGDERTIKARINGKLQELQQIIPEFIYGYDAESLEGNLGCVLLEQNKTIAVAESCTGGYISHLLTSVAGSSQYFLGSVVAYANEVKTAQLGVQKEMLEKYGAVSEETAKQMAAGVRENLRADIGVATTGLAGPGGGTEDKPVGMVWIAIATADRVYAEKFMFGDNRERNIVRASITALNMARKALINH
ncbi:MAG: competence/damage-inducible protein CinA [Bacteroidetes bacterium]|nr:MAG: competence/damage-inducible protein CinA [Bacteroidota bacterium]